MGAEWCWYLAVFSISLSFNGVLSAEQTKIHNFMAQISGQMMTEEVEMVF